VFSAQLERAMEAVRRLGFTVIGLVGGLIALWLIWKYVQRERFIREISMDRITPDDLRRKLEAASRSRSWTCVITSISTRTRGRCRRASLRRGRARAASSGDPRDRDVVLYCT